MNLADKRLRALENPHLSANERARLRCEVASELIQNGLYEAAREALGVLWSGIGARPKVTGLEEVTAAEVLLQCGALSGWIGTSKRVRGAQENAKDLLSEALRLFEAHGRQKRVAEAEYELGMCYWRSGALNEARLVLCEAISKLSDEDVEQKGRILIRSTLIEVSAGRYHDALTILDEAESVFETASDALKGRWHGQRGMVLRRLGAAEGRVDFLDRAIIEFTAAVIHFEQVGHERYCGNAENNLAMLLNRMERHKEAHEHLDRAQRIFVRLNDAGNLAQVRETRARVWLAEGEYKRAADVIGGVVGALEKAGEQALLADALTVQATVQARLGQYYLALPTFRRAVRVAEAAGASEGAGLAALSLMEECGATRLSEMELYKVYCHADDLLRQTQDAEAIARLRGCARVVTQRLAGERLDAHFSLPEAIKSLEARSIRRALQEAGGSISRAAGRLGISYQRLGYLLETRHQELLPARRPVVKRRRSIIKRPKGGPPQP